MTATEDAGRRTADPAGEPWTIRLARAEEYEEAGRVTAEAYTSSYGDLPQTYLDSLRDAAGRAASGDVWIAVGQSGAVLGTVWVARAGVPLADVARPGETDFRQLAVAPAARGRGIGEALTRHVIALARERGSHRVVMNSGPEMTGAHALYAKVGFRRLPDRERRIEVEPGRWIDLLAFGYDVRPAPEPAGGGGWHLEYVSWEDPRAAALRDEMAAEVTGRYAGRSASRRGEEDRRPLLIDPATIVATVLAVAPDGRLAGHVAVRDLHHDDTRDLEVKRLFVRPWARGRGAAKALMAEAEQVAAGRGAPRLILHTGDRQPDAVALYEGLGYTPIPVYEPYRRFAFSASSRTFEKVLPARE